MTAAADADKGMVRVDAAQWDALQDAAKAGQEARTAQLTAHRDGVIMAAVRAGKFPPARKEHWEKLWAADPEGTEQTIGTLAVRPRPPRGHRGCGRRAGHQRRRRVHGAVRPGRRAEGLGPGQASGKRRRERAGHVGLRASRRRPVQLHHLRGGHRRPAGRTTGNGTVRPGRVTVAEGSRVSPRSTPRPARR